MSEDVVNQSDQALLLIGQATADIAALHRILFWIENHGSKIDPEASTTFTGHPMWLKLAHASACNGAQEAENELNATIRSTWTSLLDTTAERVRKNIDELRAKIKRLAVTL